MSLLPGAPFDPLFLPRLGGGQLQLPPGAGLLLFFEPAGEADAAAARAVARIARTLAPRGLAVLAIGRGEPAATAAFASRHGLGAVDVGLDLSSGPVSSEFELDVVPAAFVVQDGRVVACVDGWSRRDYNAIAAAAADLVGAPAPTASDPADGLPDHAPGITATTGASPASPGPAGG